MENPSACIHCLFSEASHALSLFTLSCTFRGPALCCLFAPCAERHIWQATVCIWAQIWLCVQDEGSTSVCYSRYLKQSFSEINQITDPVLNMSIFSFSSFISCITFLFFTEINIHFRNKFHFISQVESGIIHGLYCNPQKTEPISIAAQVSVIETAPRGRFSRLEVIEQ